MRAFIKSAILAGLLAAISPFYINAQPRFTHSDIKWENVSEGIDFSRVYAYDKGSKVDSMAVVKIDDKKNSFYVRHSYKPTTIDNWQRMLDAPVVFNASFFENDCKPTTAIITDGEVIANDSNKIMDVQKEYLAMKGFFAADPLKKDKSLTDIIDMSAEKLNMKDWNQGIVSYPMLLYKDGSIKVNQREKWNASRTAIAKDKDGNVLLFSTEGGYFTLNDFANFLKESKFNVYEALNLDGGLATGLCIKTDNKKYSNYGCYEKNTIWGDISNKNTKIKMPCVVAVYKRLN